MRPRWAYLLFFVSVVLHFVMAYGVQRADTLSLLGVFGACWAVFLIQWTSISVSTRQLIGCGVMLRAVYLLSVPELSDDVYRYIWDGMVTNKGLSPYAFVPAQWSDVGLSESVGQLLSKVNSPDYYSVYPPVLQVIFAVSAWLGNSDPISSVIALRVLVIIAEAGSMWLIGKLLENWRMNPRGLMLYALNPLVVVEFTGNLHSEAFMVFFLLLSLMVLSGHIARPSASDPDRESRSISGIGNGRLMLSAVAYGLSIGTKLLPLIFLPFFIKRLGWARALIFGGMAVSVAAVLFVPYWTPGLVENISSSLRLYFANFEFNASIYYLIREVGYWSAGYNIIGQTAAWLPRVVLLIILLMALLDNGNGLMTLPKWMLFAWFVYYAFATTVHPWYVAVMAAFLPFVRYRFALVWLITVPLSYHAYAAGNFHEEPWMLALEYVPVYGWLGLELGLFRPFERWWALRRAEVKHKRLMPLYTDRESVLEVGSGNGALVKCLREGGLRMTALDISDNSLFQEVQVNVYDGRQFPFADKQFDVCQMITMLHHTNNAEELIGEAKRVAHRVIIMEDIFEDPVQKYVTWFTDSLVNWEFYGHPHTNRSDAEWRSLFEQHGLLVEQVEYYRFLLFFRQVTYVLVQAEKKD